MDLQSAALQVGKALNDPKLGITALSRAGDRAGWAAAWRARGQVAEARGDLQAALEDFRRAVVGWRTIGDPREALALDDLAAAAIVIGEMEEAYTRIERALALHRAAGNRRGEAGALMLRGWGRFLDGAADRALPDYDRALDLYRDAGDRVGEAEVLDRRGSALRALGRLEEARRSFEQSLALARAAGQRDGARATLSNLGNLALAAGDPERARRLHAEALTVARELGDPFGEMAARLGDARALRRLGRLDEARAQLEAAIATLETARGELARADHRRAFLAVFHHPYEELIDLLAGRALDEPGGGWAEQAFAAAERARARNLFESLAAAGGPEGGGAVVGGGAASGGGGSPGPPAPAEPAPVLSAAEVAERVLDCSPCRWPLPTTLKPPDRPKPYAAPAAKPTRCST
jgi:tetratricopeptide (TPR) repeat protein